MKLRRSAFIFLSAFLFIIVGNAVDKKTPPGPPTIYWLFFDFPSAVDLSNSDRPGSLVEMYRVLTEKMPEYRHQVVDIPVMMAIQRMKMNKNSCSFMFIKNPEREDYMTFGAPLFQGDSNGIFVRKDDMKIKKYLEDKDKSKVLNLDEMIKDKSIRIGIQNGRFHGKKITDSVNLRKGAGVVTKQGSNVDKELRVMLSLGRIDAYFGYSLEPNNKSNIEFYYVKDNFEKLEPRISCEKTAFGEEVIAKTQEVRHKYSLDSEFAKIFKSYYLSGKQ